MNCSVDTRPKYAVPALEKGLDILECLSGESIPMTQSQLSRSLGKQPGELFRMLNCLENRGYVRRDAVSGAYSLSLRLFELSRMHTPYDVLLRVASPLMRQLADELRESCHVSVLHREHLLVIGQQDSQTPLRYSVEVGSVHSVSRTTSGRLLLAFSRDDKCDDILSRDDDFISRSAEEKLQFKTHLSEIRARGDELTANELVEGGFDLGTIVGSEASKVKAALTIATIRRKNSLSVSEWLPALMSCARCIAVGAGIIPPEPSA